MVRLAVVLPKKFAFTIAQKVIKHHAPTKPTTNDIRNRNGKDSIYREKL